MTDAFWRRFLVPGALWLLFFFLVPFGIAVLISLGENNDFGGVTYGWNPSNYADALDPLFAPVLLRSVGYAAATAALCLLIGYPVAYCIARFGGRRRNLLIAAILAPFLVNYLVRTYAWVALLADEGLVNGVITDSGVSNTPVQFLNTPWAVIGGLVYGYLGFMILPIYASLERMDPALIEAGKDLYGSPRQTFWHVTWPQTVPGVLAGTRARVPARGRRLRLRPAARRARHLHGGQPDPAAVLRRRELAVRVRPDDRADGVPGDLHVLLPPRSGLRRAAGGAGMSVAAERPVEVAQPAARRRGEAREGLRPPADAVGRHRPRLRVPVRADPDRDPVLVQLGEVAADVRGLLAALVRGVLRRRVAAHVAAHVARDRRRHHRRRDGARHRRSRSGWRGRARA